MLICSISNKKTSFEIENKGNEIRMNYLLYFLEAVDNIYFCALFRATSIQGRVLLIFLKSLHCSCQNWYAAVSIRMFFLREMCFLCV